MALPFTSCVILNSVSSWLKTIPSPRIIKKIGQIVHVNYFSMIVLIQNLFSLGEHFSPFSILSSLNFSLHLVNGCSFSATCLIQLVSCQPCSAMPWTAAPQAPLSVGFPRQECGSGWRFPSAGGLPKSGITPMPPVFAALQADSLLHHQGSPTRRQGRSNFMHLLVRRVRCWFKGSRPVLKCQFF